MPLTLLFGLLVGGCAESHTRYDGMRCRVPVGMVCCNAADLPETHWESLCPFECPIGRRLVRATECGPAFAPADASFPPIDAGSPPPPPPTMCPPVRAIGACSPAPGLVAVVGEPFEVPYRMNECGCCPSTECQVEAVNPLSRVVSLITTLCPDPCDCDECAPIRGTCRVPGLPFAGEWQVHINGAPGVVLPVEERAGRENPSGCGTFAAADLCPASEPLAAEPFEPTEVCVRQRIDRPVLEVRHDCWGCDHMGPCITYFNPEEHGGGDIHLSPTRYGGACDGDCTDACHLLTHHCEIPDLPPGDGVYQVLVGGRVVATLGTGDDWSRSTVCGE